MISTICARRSTAIPTRRMPEHFALDNAEDLILSCYLSQDFKEGARAFLDKRKPNWQGR